MWLCVYQNTNVPGPEAYWCIVVYRGEESKPLASEQYLYRTVSIFYAGWAGAARTEFLRQKPVLTLLMGHLPASSCLWRLWVGRVLRVCVYEVRGLMSGGLP
jgi:hypothetical protein